LTNNYHIEVGIFFYKNHLFQKIHIIEGGF